MQIAGSAMKILSAGLEMHKAISKTQADLGLLTVTIFYNNREPFIEAGVIVNSHQQFYL